ncbi:hypothetical protein FSOLCH5_007639 [Fusarium solani]
MDEWKVMTQEIRSRCGFCGINLMTWASRVDHLADHFKAGSTMEHWKGDWGFDTKIIDRIDNAMPPYLIHHERNSPLPFAATKGPADTPTSAYELIKLELEYYMRNTFHAFGSLPQDPELHFEGCSVILGAEIISPNPASSAPSWLWDIFMSCTEIANQARLRPTKQLAESRLSQLKINGKGNIFENCELEAALRQYMAAHAANQALDNVNGAVLGDMNVDLQNLSNSWMPLTETDMALENRSLSPGISEGIPNMTSPLINQEMPSHDSLDRALLRDKVRTATPFFINDNNSYRRLKRELSRFVITTMSQNNPNRHIPSDDELKYQARWILYDE